VERVVSVDMVEVNYFAVSPLVFIFTKESRLEQREKIPSVPTVTEMEEVMSGAVSQWWY
jgi:hypothetical protein